MHMDNILNTPSLNVIPLNKNNEPVYFAGEEPVIPSFTIDGYIKLLPLDIERIQIGGNHKGYIIPLIRDIKSRIKQKYPGGIFSRNKPKQYCVAALCVSVDGSMAFIFEVNGLETHRKELDVLYDKLKSLQGCQVGDNTWNAVHDYFATDPVRSWINRFVNELGSSLDWTNYVNQALSSLSNSAK